MTSPAITPLRSVELRELNEMVSRVRQRLERLDRVAATTQAGASGDLALQVQQLSQRVAALSQRPPTQTVSTSRSFSFFLG